MMNNLFTEVAIPSDMPRFSHADRLLMIGSCFATHIGERLARAKFRCDTNPFGVLYNPLSIGTALRQIMAGKPYGESDLFCRQGTWHSNMHHSDFSSSTSEETLQRINERLQQAHRELSRLSGLLLTWGTAYVYEEKATRLVVGNCHKRPEKDFIRKRLSVQEIVDDYAALLPVVWEQNPDLNVLFTVSPIRHVRDGLHENQLSKATLLLAIDELKHRYPERVHYFPAYELLTDELRDYRFYADDLVHPSEKAVDYVWQRFCEACFPPETLKIMASCEEIYKMLQHKPFCAQSDSYKSFLGQITLKIEQLKAKLPYLDFEFEKEICRTRLKL